MTVIFYVLVLALLLALAAFVFANTDPKKLSRAIALAGPVLLGLAGIALLLVGRATIGLMLLTGAVGWWSSGRLSRGRRSGTANRSTVRTAALEMILDHESGTLEGMVLAGPFEGRMLADLAMPDLMRLHAALETDAESRQLLETYLDGREPGWRDDAQANGSAGLGDSPGSGTMTHQEAYQILGLEPGAGAAEIRKAHRSLMQRVHPDKGGSSFLAARINAAKDFLLKHHQ